MYLREHVCDSAKMNEHNCIFPEEVYGKLPMNDVCLVFSQTLVFFVFIRVVVRLASNHFPSYGMTINTNKQ